VFVFLDISLRALHRSLRALFCCPIYEFLFIYISIFFCFKSFFGLYIEAARFYLLSSMLQESLRILFVLSALSHRPVMTRVSLFSGVRDAVLMCDKTGCRRRGIFCFFLYDNVFFIYLKKVARICFSIVELRKKNVTRQVAKLGD